MSVEEKIKCPHCGENFPIAQALAGNLEAVVGAALPRVELLQLAHSDDVQEETVDN